jgi:hypothetical protein
MRRSISERPPAQSPAAGVLDAALKRIAALYIEERRNLWRERRGQEPPTARSKGNQPMWHLKVGSVIVREYDGGLSGASLDRPALQALLDLDWRQSMRAP